MFSGGQGVEKECMGTNEIKAWFRDSFRFSLFKGFAETIQSFYALSYTDVSDASKKQFRELQVKYFELKEKHDDLTERLKFFTKVIKI